MLTGNPYIVPTDVAGKGGNAGDIFAGAMKMTLVAGAAANTNITVAGIKPEDKIWKVLEFVTAAAIATMADRTADVTVIGDGVIQFGVITTSNQLVVIWLDRNP
jgi:hypothetical protein